MLHILLKYLFVWFMYYHLYFIVLFLSYIACMQPLMLIANCILGLQWAFKFWNRTWIMNNLNESHCFSKWLCKWYQCIEEILKINIASKNQINYLRLLVIHSYTGISITTIFSVLQIWIMKYIVFPLSSCYQYLILKK